MPPQAVQGGAAGVAVTAESLSRNSDNLIVLGDGSLPVGPTTTEQRQQEQLQQRKQRQEIEEKEQNVLFDDKGRLYNLGPEGFVRDLNTRAVKIARRVAQRATAASSSAPAAVGIGRDAGTTAAAAASAPAQAEALLAAAAAVAGGVVSDAGASGTVRTSIAQEIQFVLGGRLPFVKRSEFLVWTWVCLSAYFLVRYGFLGLGVAPTLGAFTVMYFVLDFYSGVLHVVLDDEWNMKVPLLSQPAMEFQYHHHIPDDGCSRPFVEGMGDLNFIIGLHLALFMFLYVRGGGEDKMLLTAGGWKMLIAYWGIWNHRQAHQLKSKRPRWCTYLQERGVMLSPAAHKVHHTPPHDDEYCLLGVTTWPVTWLGRMNLGSVFWIALFLVLTALDTVCASRLLSAVFR